MRHLLGLFSLSLSVLLISCSSPMTAQPLPTANSQTLVVQSSGQKLPVSAIATFPDEAKTKIKLEVAKTPTEQAMGLMYRPALPDDGGMLFVFSPPQPVSFWMKNVPVALDMVFLKDGVVKYIEASAPPCSSEPCPSYGPGPKVPIDNVIELRSGRAAELKLQVSDVVKIEQVVPENTSK